MPVGIDHIGRSTDFVEHDIDARWLMAYAASISDFNNNYMNTDIQKVCAHPVFPVCLEWPSILNTRAFFGKDLSAEESARGVHAAHDLHLYRPILAGETLRTNATLIGIEQIKPGAGYTLRLDTIDQTDTIICRTFQYGIYRNVAVKGENYSCERSPDVPQPANLERVFDTISIREGAAHTYTECARIWNPIHTDRKFARDAGLPDIILHGTSTLALTISKLVDEFANGEPRRIKRLGGKFSGMVFMPSQLDLISSNPVKSGDQSLVSFEVRQTNGEPVITRGFFVFD